MYIIGTQMKKCGAARAKTSRYIFKLAKSRFVYDWRQRNLIHFCFEDL